MSDIKAKTAREITNLSGPVIEPFITVLGKEVRRVASQGKSSFDPWHYLSTLRSKSPTVVEREAIRSHFLQSGFNWEDHPDPGPGHPCSRPYTTLNW